jgi:WD40 repeat protein
MELADTPDVISCGEQIFDIAFHPLSDVVAVGLIDGHVNIYKYSTEINELVVQFRHHNSSCRGLKFSEDGQVMYTISSDMSWLCIDGDGRVVSSVPHSHEAPINKLQLLSESTIATGDDAGVVKIWDCRQSTEVMKFTLHEDFVSGFTYCSENQTLISVGGDATLCSYDLRKKNNSFRSDDQESELHCVDIIKNNRKVVVGTQDGVLLTFSWGKWGDCTDRYPGHPQTVDCMLKIDESSILTGSSDGLIRAVSIQPNRILGIIGDHEDFPVEGMQKDREGKFLGSYSHDDVLRFWDISMFIGDEDDDDNQIDSESDGDDMEVADSSGVITNNNAMENDSEEDSEGDWEDASDDSDEENGDKKKMPTGDMSSDTDSDDDITGNNRNRGVRRIPTASERFYADL